MKPLMFTLFLFTMVFAGCSAESIVGPAEDGRALQPAQECSINTRLC